MTQLLIMRVGKRRTCRFEHNLIADQSSFDSEIVALHCPWRANTSLTSHGHMSVNFYGTCIKPGQDSRQRGTLPVIDVTQIVLLLEV